ncbi:response regulator (plasmid) [Azospirillum baldaniorum]|uniref:Response regulator receiver protein n=1 Tax=Azospirillum baldaniorum TaxID=1064539 RepID=A0A9P1JYN6_9PROT|nr:response regulator [Azospirillum baldaniorum]AWJ93130.1 response regulator [Azospirillum baldaniorum]TWA52901.1 response regulator receiver domain-containing protein [Azospirillum baldaniorum]TWA76101.1 response regulator receiver domain-containing protein [Azospirillum brasilense]CCD02263.1 response regulator receiver protein [Azospirillum baldaniorum]
MQNPPTLERILYIDDEPMLQMLVGLSLQKARGWSVHACLTGGQAVASALEKAPQLILLDVMLPDIDGTEVFAALRREPQLGAVPIVFLSGRCDQANQERFTRLGGCGVIGKPINPLSLPGQIEAIWNNWHENPAIHAPCEAPSG